MCAPMQTKNMSRERWKFLFVFEHGNIQNHNLYMYIHICICECSSLSNNDHEYKPTQPIHKVDIGLITPPNIKSIKIKLGPNIQLSYKTPMYSQMNCLIENDYNKGTFPKKNLCIPK